MLVSADFLASDYCYDVELARAMQRHAAGEARIIPVILRPCDWQTAGFGKLRPLPKNGLPITKWGDRDEAFLNVVQGLRAVIIQFKGEAIATKKESLLTPSNSTEVINSWGAAQGSTTRSHIRHRLKPQYVLVPLVGAGMIAIALVMVQTLPRFFNLQPTSSSLLPSPSTESFVLPSNFEQMNFQTADVAMVEAIASHYFRNQDLPKAEKAFNALLERGALEAADSAFKSVSKEDLSKPSINFLRGKLAWQAVKQGNPDYYSTHRKFR